MADASIKIVFYHTEVAGVTKDACQLTGQGMERGVEDEVTTVTMGDGIFHLTAHENDAETE